MNSFAASASSGYEFLPCSEDEYWRVSNLGDEAWVPSFLTEGRRKAVDQRTQLANEIKSQLKVYFPLALQVLDNDCSTALAAELLLAWPTLEKLQKQNAQKMRKFFHAHHSRGEKKKLERLELIRTAKPLTRDQAVIGPGSLRVKLLAQQLKSLLPYIAQYETQIAELFQAHPDSFLFRDLPGAGPALGPRLLSAFGTDRERFEHSSQFSSLSGIAPVRRASGQKTGKKASVHSRQACPKFLRQSLHEFAACSIRCCSWAQACYSAQRARGKGHHAAVRPVLSNGSESFLCAGKTASPTIPIAISRPSKIAVHNTLKSSHEPHSKFVNKLSGAWILNATGHPCIRRGSFRFAGILPRLPA